MRRMLWVLPCLLLTGCLPPAGWSAEGYSVDNSRSADGRQIVGHCYRLLVDANVYPSPQRIDLRGGGEADVYGYLAVVDDRFATSRPATPANLPKGSTIVVERSVLWRNVEDSSMRPFVRIDGNLIDAKRLFQDGAGPTFRMRAVDGLIEPCDASNSPRP